MSHADETSVALGRLGERAVEREQAGIQPLRERSLVEVVAAREIADADREV
jgi:hypothetical protein